MILHIASFQNSEVSPSPRQGTVSEVFILTKGVPCSVTGTLQSGYNNLS